MHALRNMTVSVRSQSAKTGMKARNAWPFVAAQLFWVFLSTKGLLFVCRIIPSLAKLLLAHFVIYNAVVTIVTDVWYLLTAFWFSKSKTIHSFSDDVGLNLKPNVSVLPYVLAATGLGFITVIGAMKGLTGGNWVAQVFAKQSGVAWSYYILYACSVSAFAEEIAKRGFLYQAFRGSYGIPLSITLIICWELFAHWAIASHSIFTFSCYSLFAILLCIVREKTRSIWNCIFCHSIYNAVTTRQWAICIFVMLIFLFIIFRDSHPKPQTKTLAN
jgi:membrane protease YdiL (CAAX protease family)